MNTIRFMTDFVIVFGTTLLVCISVTFLFSLMIHGVAIIDWETSFRFATLLGIIVPLFDYRKGRKSMK